VPPVTSHSRFIVTSEPVVLRPTIFRSTMPIAVTLTHASIEHDAPPAVWSGTAT
jgi:hypothetical protein